MKQKLTLLLIISLVCLNFPASTKALTLQEILQGRDNPSTSSGPSAGQVLGASTVGLIAHWKFDETSGNTASDSAGTNIGTLVGSPVWSAGRINGGITFNQTNYIQINKNIISAGAMTFCVWVKPAPITAYNAYILGYSWPLWFTVGSDTGANLSVTISNNGTNNTAKSAEIIAPNVWTHVCAVRNSDGTASLFVNGALSGAANQSAGAVSAATNFVISGRGGEGSYFLNGSLDDYRVYSRSLSAQEVLDVYNDTGTSPTPTPTPTPTPSMTPTPTPTITPTPSPTPTPTPLPSGVVPWSGIIDSSRAIDWSTAGVVGEIPSSSWTQCGATISAGASAGTIQTAINNCGTNQYVKLGAGTFNLTTGLVMKSNMALRGSGADQTFLNFTGADPCAGGWTTICFGGGDSSNWSGSSKVMPGGSNSADWTAGYAKGATQITLSNIGSGGIKVGQYIYLDQASDTATNGALFNCETTSANPPCSVEGGAGNPGRVINGIARQQIQIVKVVGCSPSCSNGATFTISPGLHAPNWNAGKSPGAWWSSEIIENAGLENLSVDASNSSGLSNVSMYNGANLWVYGTRQVRNCNCTRSIIAMAPATHSTIANNYFFGTSGHSQNYGVESYIASDNLVVNNIFQHVVSPMMIHSNQGSVYAYNYAINDPYDDGRLPIYHWMAGMIGGHSGGVLYNLFEGNIGPALGSDYIHGNQTMNTIFRNYFLGSEPNRIDNTNAISIASWNRYWNIVGNVLGTPGYTTAYAGFNKGIYNLGYGYAPLPDDPLVAGTLLRWGNYDTVNAATRWLASEVPTSAPTYPNLIPASQTLPASLYYNSRPSWWPAAKAWPAIGPDVSGGNIANLAGHAYTIPAQDCYLNVMNGPVDGGASGGATPLSFNASLCYASAGSGDTTAPSVPTGLSASTISTSQINLTWTASTDNVGVTGYRIYRGGVLVGTSVSNSYSDSNLSPSTLYSYTVSAYDAAGNTSSQSASASATTQSGQPVPGDLNLDHIVNALDYSLLNSKWLQSFSAYDLQADGLINSLDFAILSSNWGKTW